MSAGKLVVISDLHLHPWAAFSTGDGLENDRLQRTLGVLRASLERAQQLDCPWVFGGDLVHTAGYALNVVLAALAEEFGRFPNVPKLAVWGNHDARGVGGRISMEQTIWAALSKAVSNLAVLDPSLAHPVEERGGLTFSGAGAQPSLELLRAPMRADVGVYHTMVRGSRGPNGYEFPHGVEVDDLRALHRIAIVGDLHHPQLFQRPLDDGLVLVPGSPEHHNFGDVGPHGWWVVTIGVDKGEIRTDFVPSNSPGFLTVQSAEDVRADGNFYRVLSNRAGAKLPKNAIVVSPAPTAVESRAVLRGLTREQILAAWLHEAPPGEAIQLGATELQLLALGRQLLAAEGVGQLCNIRLKRIALTNFCSYAETEFEIRDGTWLVLGKGRDYPSNGAGKSTLFEAIFWLLFGRTTKGLSGDEVIRWETKTCAVRAVFENQYGGVLEVRRTRGEASRLEVYEGDDAIPWEATSVNEMTEKLSRHLGITPELFQALGYFSQERVLLFASATDGERKEMLADLIGLSAYQTAAAEAQSCIEQLKLEMAETEGLQKATEARLAADRIALEGTRLRAANWEEERARRRRVADDALAAFDSDREQMRVQLMAEAVRQLSRSNSEAEYAERALLDRATMELQKQRPTPVDEAKARASSAAAAEARGTVIHLAAQLEETERYLAPMKLRLVQTERLMDSGLCPSCGQRIGPEHREQCLSAIKKDVVELEARGVGLKEKQAEAIRTAAALKLQADADERSVLATREITEWRTRADEARVRLAQLQRARADVEAVAARHVDGVLEAKWAELQAELQRIAAEINPHRFAEKAAAARMVETERMLAEAAAERRQMDVQVEMHEYWRRGFSKQGIQSLLMDEVASVFNADRGAIFPALTQGVYDVQFSTLSRTKAGEARERTEFKIYEHGEAVPYESLSGGQRRRIDVGVMLTLVKAVSAWMQVPGALGLLVLDEVFGFLDASGAEGLMEALRDVQAVVPAIYAISHDPQLQALFSGVVMVEQGEDGVSRIVGGGEANVDAVVEASQ